MSRSPRRARASIKERKRPGRRVGVEMDLEDEADTRKKMDKQKKKLQKELRDVEKFSCVAKEFQERLKSNLQQQLQEGGTKEARFHAVQKSSQKIQSIQDKRRNLQKNSTAAEEEMRKLQEELKQEEEVSFSNRTKSGCRNGGRASEFAGGKRKQRR